MKDGVRDGFVMYCISIQVSNEANQDMEFGRLLGFLCCLEGVLINGRHPGVRILQSRTKLGQREETAQPRVIARHEMPGRHSASQ